jgi:poly [ADP-ribose] polymerase
MAALSLPMTEAAIPASAVGPALSQASAVTSTSNAFEEVADGLNFGPDFFGMDSWSAFPHGWGDIGHFSGNGIS